MEFNEDPIEEKEIRDEDYVDIYSKRAIFGFSVFSNVFGGILLVINLWVAGYKRAVTEVLLFLVSFNIASYYLSLLIIKYANIKVDPDIVKKASAGTQLTINELMPLIQLTGISLAFNIIAAFVYTRYFFKKYFPDNDYYPKSILRPLIIYIIIALFSRSIF